MLELEINGMMFGFNFGMGFLREINKKVKVPIDEFKVEKNSGFSYYLADMLSGSVEALAMILVTANYGQSPRVTPSLIDAYIDDPNTDIDELMDDVVGFLSEANSTRQITKNMLKAMEEAKPGN